MSFRECFKLNPPLKSFCRDLPVRLPDIDDLEIRKPVPENYPILELAATMIELVKAVEGEESHTVFGQQLLDVSRDYIKFAQSGMPAGVEIRETISTMEG